MIRALRVLQIEDNESDADLLLRELHRAGYDAVSRRVDTMPALKEALEEDWDVILCDFRMPKLNALMALDIVRSRQIDTPFIIVSGTVGEEHAVAALRSGAQDFVLKDKLTRLIPAIERELRDSETRIKRALAESALRATEASFRAAFELIPDAILACREGLIVHANRSAATMLGAPRQKDVLDCSLVDLFTPADQETVRERLQETLRSREPVAFGELTMVRLDGARISVEATATSVVFEGEPAILAVVRDISARQELIARSMQVDRMLAVGTLAAGVGHEINNPLAYVTANIAYVSDQVVRTRQELETVASRDPSVLARLTELSEVVSVLSEVS
ncbi:MAG TPA: PAS domain S-box protein, partial [Vicinamibacterales bacterium]|nr:PAS domain S-box protein [Vicinamibacterales bacterium]